METFDRLEAAKVDYVGAGRTRERAYGPTVVEHEGFRVAFVAVTTIWNQELSPHPGRELIADATVESLVIVMGITNSSPELTIGGAAFVTRIFGPIHSF